MLEIPSQRLNSNKCIFEDRKKELGIPLGYINCVKKIDLWRNQLIKISRMRTFKITFVVFFPVLVAFGPWLILSSASASSTHELEVNNCTSFDTLSKGWIVVIKASGAGRYTLRLKPEAFSTWNLNPNFSRLDPPKGQKSMPVRQCGANKQWCHN